MFLNMFSLLMLKKCIVYLLTLNVCETTLFYLLIPFLFCVIFQSTSVTYAINYGIQLTVFVR